MNQAHDQIENFSKKEWSKNWAGQWSFLSCTYFGQHYTKGINEVLGTSLHYSLFIYHQGTTSAYFEVSDARRFCKELAAKIAADHGFAEFLCSELKVKTDNILGIIKELENKQISKDDYARFTQALYEYAPSHRAVKMVVDYLDPQNLDELLPSLEEARLYSEPVYVESEKFTQLFAEQLAKGASIEKELMLCVTRDELDIYLENKTLPAQEILQARFENGVILYEKGEYTTVIGNEAVGLEKAIEGLPASTKTLKGKTAFSGKVRGTVRIVLDPSKPGEFNEGDILVTGMTRPEYLSLMQKSAGVITDAGGMLSHAAITARELKKPCVVGTQVATKILKNGDVVEIDADKGEVIIL
ncbi:MAG: PEP-utilizing enzyme [Candidatus Andersenbacteria bacterium]